MKTIYFFKLEDHATTISQKASLVNLTLYSVFQVDKAHFERDTFHKRLLLKFNSIELLLPVAFKGMIAPCGHICFHWAKCSNNLHVWLKFAKTKMMFVEEIVDCKNSQLSLYKDFDQSMYSILVTKTIIKREYE